jgi:hypothetical protein
MYRTSCSARRFGVRSTTPSTFITILCTIVRSGSCGCSTAGVAAASKIAIVTPSGLVGNWKAEFQRWLGQQRVDPCVVNCIGKVRSGCARTTPCFSCPCIV